MVTAAVVRGAVTISCFRAYSTGHFGSVPVELGRGSAISSGVIPRAKNRENSSKILFEKKISTKPLDQFQEELDKTPKKFPPKNSP